MTNTNANGKLTLGNKLAFAAGDIFGGGTFNLVNFLFIPFLTLVMGIPMLWASPLLLLTKVWDGIIDPFIGAVTDGKKPGKFGKRRYFMLIFAPILVVGLVLLFFPWNLVTTSLPLKIVLVTISYMMYATAQSFILIPYYGLTSEMTDDFFERNKANAMRLAFSLISSLICVAVPGMIASPTGSVITNSLGLDASFGYIIMAGTFGTIFALAVLVTALFAREQVITPPVKSHFSFKRFFSPLKFKPYRNYLGMYMCNSMAMAIVSSFFFVFCDFVIRKDSNVLAISQGLSRFPIATVAAALLFVAQVVALPMYLRVIKAKSRSFTYCMSAILWACICLVILFLPAEPTGSAVVEGSNVINTAGTSDIALMTVGFVMGLCVGGCLLVPHSAFGEVCQAGQLYFGERNEGHFSGLTNFLNTVAQAVGLALPPLIMALPFFGRYVETQYISASDYQLYLNGTLDAVADLGLSIDSFKVTVSDSIVSLVPMMQSAESQLVLRLVFTLLPIAVMAVGFTFAKRYNLTRERQQRIDKLLHSADSISSEQFESERKEILDEIL